MSASEPLDIALLDRFAAIVGEKHVVRDPKDMQPYLKEPRDKFKGITPLVLKPATVAEISAILRLATQTHTAIVPQGGNTGHVGGQVPDASGRQIIMSLARLNRIRSVDPVGNLLVAESGCILKTVQDAAASQGRLFPLSLGSEGTCQIGGNLSTNAGGTAVLAYGNTRELCLGLEVVLPTGEVLDDLRRVKKDNTGYDLKDLFIGAEGTLGVITAAVLKLFPQPRGKAVAYAGLKSPEDALKLFGRAQDRAGSSLTGFELMPRLGLEFVVKHIQGGVDPLAAPYEWYVLLDISSSRSEEDAQATMEAILGDAYEAGLIGDAAIASSKAQEQTFWMMRESMSEAQKPEGGSIKHDISVPVASIPAFLNEATAAVRQMIPSVRPVPFGHMGDGNIHFNFTQPVGMDKEAFLERWADVNARVHEIVRSYHGSISAEHGIGQLKRDELLATKSPMAIELMRQIKSAVDPASIMNPGKVI
ncbi:MAG: FAD-binding oxidoreductase [Phyllobacterium sp.]